MRLPNLLIVVIIVIVVEIPSWTLPSVVISSTGSELVQCFYLESLQGNSHRINLLPTQHRMKLLVVGLFHLSAFHIKCSYPHDHLLVVTLADVGVSPRLHHNIPLLLGDVSLFGLHLVQQRKEFRSLCFGEVCFACHKVIHAFLVEFRSEFRTWLILLLTSIPVWILGIHT